LKKHGATRPCFPFEEGKISRALETYGAEAVRLAFMGAIYEPSSKEFNPANYLSLIRIFAPDKIERFINLGARAEEKIRIRKENQVKLDRSLQGV